MELFCFNQDWRFFRGECKEMSESNFCADEFELVHLPHTVREEKANCSGGKNYQGIAWYRKEFYIPENTEGKKLFLEFEGAKTYAQIWLNGKKLYEHFGGYLPFRIDITNHIKYDINVVAVRLDNSDFPDIPPGKPQCELDFCYFGGLYRNVNLIVKDFLHITDAASAGIPAGGGVFVTYPVVSEDTAVVLVKTHVKNEYGEEKKAALCTTVVGGASNFSEEILIDSEHTFVQEIVIQNPKLWSVDEPNLYMLKSEVVSDGKITDTLQTTIGIRRFSFSGNGFELNGNSVKLNGANRHQEFVYVGDATTRSLHFRDAKKLKDAGFNFIRLGHYPHTVDFLDACDILGLVCVEPTPGWQWFCETELFCKRSLEATAEMIRRDRNHPCIVLWEPILNETRYTEAFALQAHNTVHLEYPTDQCYTACDCHKPAAQLYDVAYGNTENVVQSEKAVVIREYGDNYREQFSMQNTTKRVVRGAGDFYPGGGKAMLLSALERMTQLNRVYLHNQIAGAAVWTGIDFNRGYIDNIAATGVLDLYRIPKFSYYMYQSQSEKPMVFIADFWESDVDKLVVFSNCDEVRLYINGTLIGQQKPDREYLNKKKTLSQASNMYESGHVLNEIREDFVQQGLKGLPHPPFIFKEISYCAGTIQAEGIINGAIAASHKVMTPNSPAKISLEADNCGMDLVADGSDLLMIYAYLLDENDTIVNSADNEIIFSISGEGTLVGTNPINAEAGIIGILLRATKTAGNIVITAQTEGLTPATLSIHSTIDTKKHIVSPPQRVVNTMFAYEADTVENNAKTSVNDYNVALNKTVVATSEKENFPARSLTDGDNGTKWVAENNEPQELIIDLENHYDINGCKIWWENDNTDYTYRIDTSADGENWRNAIPSKTGTGQDTAADTFWTDDARFLKLQIEHVSKEVAGIYNILVFGMEI